MAAVGHASLALEGIERAIFTSTAVGVAASADDAAVLRSRCSSHCDRWAAANVVGGLLLDLLHHNAMSQVEFIEWVAFCKDSRNGLVAVGGGGSEGVFGLVRTTGTNFLEWFGRGQWLNKVLVSLDEC